jgi:hypothetical protein
LIRALAGAAALLLVAAPGAAAEKAEPFDAASVPEALRPWIDWVRAADPERDCPLVTGAERRACVYAGALSLDVGGDGARFLQRVEVFGRGAWVALPGDASLRPQDVRAGGQPVAVVAGGVPRTWLPPGRHEIDGTLRFAGARPATLPVPPATALVSLVLDGVAVALPVRDGSGALWLEARAADPAPEDALDVAVFRRIVDEVPLEIETRLSLRVAGRPREAALGPALPAGFVPLALSGAVPARFESDGRVRAQVRPGHHELVLRARHPGPVAEISPPAAAAPWPAEEVWSFDARPALRIVAVEGATAIDPNQTELPYEWRQLPAYALRAGDAMRLVERRRGDPDPADQLALDRTWWLDFDGGGLTFRDTVQGRLRSSTRLEMAAPLRLGRAAIGGRDWFLTRLAADGAVGVEAPPGALSLEADGRVEDADTGALPAVGWAHDFDSVQGRLNLPPGWALVHAFGADRAAPSWVTSWTLLDFFLVLVTAAAASQLFGVRAGALALVALVLTWVEPGAPKLTWIGALAGEALVRVLRGRTRALPVARALRGLAWLALALHAIPYGVDELRRGLHPAHAPPYASPLAGALGRMAAAPAAAPPTEFAHDELETRQLRGLGYVAKEERDLAVTEEVVAVPAPRPAGPAPVTAEERAAPAGPRDLRALDPDARIPTGPGIPTWEWIRVDLAWSGPVEAGQTIRLVMVSPFWSRVLSFARVLLVAALLAWILRRAARATGVPASPAAAPATAVGVAVLLALAAPPAARAEFPPRELLDELRERIAKAPACHPDCASIARLALELREDRLRLRLEAHAAVASAIPLPDGAPDVEGFAVESVAVDARASESLLRLEDGSLWLALEPGVHELLVAARVAPAAERIEIALPLPPGRVDVDAPGWSAEGLDAQGGATGALSLRRTTTPGPALAPSLAPAPPPFFARVERSIHLDVAWRVDTRVERLSAPGQAAVLDVPLLEGEALESEGIPVQDGRARVAFATEAAAVEWTSSLAPREAIALRAPESASWVESWQLAVEPIWHVDAEGIPPIAVSEQEPAPLRAWRPWPGESLLLRVRRPEGVGGATLTIDRAAVRLEPGRRSRDAALDLSLRSTQGGRHTIVMPEGAELRLVRVDGVAQPLRAEGRELSLPIRPGAQELRVEWRTPEEISWRIATPEVSLGAAAVNLTSLVTMPEDRWILAVAGPRLGPSVLFWSVLGVLGLVAFGLSRARGVPLRFHHWLLLGLGLTQVPVWMGAVVAGWLFALAWRRERGAALAPLAFDAAQVALATATVAALAVLFEAIRQGLLGAPEMQIAGRGSSARLLRWYQDRSDGALPAASVFSVPLFVYRAAMLAWALWLAVALLSWLRWVWDGFSRGGLWRPLRHSRGGAAQGKI